jgi:4'-phosphopantetheinyl transferase
MPAISYSAIACDALLEWPGNCPLPGCGADGVATSQHPSSDVAVMQLLGDTAAVEAAAALLSDAEVLRADRFVFERDRRRFIMTRAQLRRLLGARLGVQPETVEFTYGANAKPALAPRFADWGGRLRFNVSHCDEVAVFAFAFGHEVGIDVEAIREVSDADAIATRFFSPREVAAYRALHERDKPLGFVNCWTRKEAFVKAVGDGLSMPLQDFDVTLAPGEPAMISRVGHKSGAGADLGWSLASFSPAPGYVAAVVTEMVSH